MTDTNVRSAIMASVVAGAVAEFSVLPICTVQTVYQTQRNLGTVDRQTIIQVTRMLYRQYGVTAFYNSSISAISCQMVSTGSKFTLYKLIQGYRETKNNDIKNNMVNGLLSGVLSIVFTQPFDVIKNYNQRQLSVLPDLKKSLTVLYRGTKQSISKSAMLGIALYPTNDFCSSYISNPGLAALATSLIITPIIHPIDLLKRRAMANERLWLGFNPLNYYRGIFINICRTTPHFIVSMMTIHYVRNLLD